MKNKVGAPSKFPVETKVLRISRVVPKDRHDQMKQQASEFINQLQSEALKKCEEEALKSYINV